MLFVALYSQGYTNKDIENYINTYADVAVEHRQLYGIPASITLAQGILESGAGKSDLAVEANNHFGIKCHRDWTGEGYHKDDDEEQECFRVYSSARASFDDHAAFLQRRRYARLFSLDPADYRGWAQGLSDCGYATNPRYPQLLCDLIERFDLARFDRGDAPAAPSQEPIAEVEEPQPQSAEVGSVEQSIESEFDTAHPIKRRWGLHYVKAHAGDTYVIIGAELGIDAHRLAEYNDRDKGTDRNAVLQPDEIVWLEKKEKQAVIGHDTHIVAPGQTLWDIAQLYGIRLKNLASRNDIKDPEAPLLPNRVILLR